MYKNLILFFLIYNFIYPLKVSVFPLLYALVYFFTGVYWVFKNNYYSVMRSKVAGFALVLSFLLSVLGGLSVWAAESTDSIPIFQALKLTVLVLTALITVDIISVEKRSETFTFVVNSIVFSSLIVAVSASVEFFSPEVKLFLSEAIETSGNIDYESSSRVHGFASSGGASLSVAIYLSIILVSYLFFRSGKFLSIYHIFSYCGLLFSLVFIGRTGLYSAILYSAVFLIWILIKAEFSKKVSILVGVLLVAYVLEFVIYSDIFNKYFNFIWGHSFEVIKNYTESGVVSTKSSDHVADMFYMPDWPHVIFGAGFWRYPNYGYSLSDVGYIKILLAYGVFGFLMLYLYYLYVSYFAIKRLPDSFLFFGICLVGSLFVFELKEEFFLQNYPIKVFWILFSCTFLYERKNTCG